MQNTDERLYLCYKFCFKFSNIEWQKSHSTLKTSDYDRCSEFKKVIEGSYFLLNGLSGCNGKNWEVQKVQETEGTAGQKNSTRSGQMYLSTIFFCGSMLSLVIRLINSLLISIIFTFERSVVFLNSYSTHQRGLITLNFWRFFCQNAPKYFVNNRLNYFLSTVLLLLTLNVWWLLFMNKRLF